MEAPLNVAKIAHQDLGKKIEEEDVVEKVLSEKGVAASGEQ